MAGFTLVEMAIVLVIIGLIIGGVLVGADMIKAVEIRRLGSMVEKLNTSVNAFQAKYNCLPGDCPFITNYFADFGAVNCVASSNVQTATTCNGNGDGDIYSVDGGGRYNSGQENAYFFQHLMLAGYLSDGRYCTQRNLTCQSNFQMQYWGLTIPVAVGGFYPSALGVVSLIHSAAVGPAQMIGTHHSYYFGSYSTDDFPIISPARLSQIDAKFDDGSPLTGGIETIGFYGSTQLGAGVFWSFNGNWTVGGHTGQCFDTSVSPAVYSANKGINCPMMWKAGF